MQLEKSQSVKAESKKDQNNAKGVRFVDIFSLRVLSLLTCRGKPTEKAKFLAELVNHGSKDQV